MDKEDILAKSRAEGKDEGERHAWLSGTSWAFMGTTAVYMILWFATLFINEDELSQLQPLNILYFSSIGMQWLGSGIASRRKGYIVLGILWLFLGIAHSVVYFKGLIG